MALLDEKSVNIELSKAREAFIESLKSINTGRMRPEILESVKVKAYGQEMDMKSLTTIEVLDGKYRLQPWDKGVIDSIAAAIRAANMGLNPEVRDGAVFVTGGQLTEETRKQRVKEVHDLLETAKVRLRKVRHEIIDEIEKMESVSKDDQDSAKKGLQKLVDNANSELDKIAGEKNEEIMTI